MRDLFRIAALAVVLALISPTAVMAASPNRPDECRRAKNKGCQFVEFNASRFDKKRFGPQPLYFSVPQYSKFKKLFKLKQPRFYRLSFETSKLALFR